jgi:hypothetical protein
MIRDVLPWNVVQDAILAGPDPARPDDAAEDASEAFQRLIEGVSAYRHLRHWLS